MIKNKKFITNVLEENCYVVSDETGEAVIIDCGCFSKEEFQPIADYIKSEGLKPVHLLCTHFHFDHVMGLRYPAESYELQPEGCKQDEYLYNSVPSQLKTFFGISNSEFRQIPLGRELNHDDIINFGNHVMKVIHTPGHSLGGLCFYCEEESILWSGDTLFYGSVGRTDLPGGNHIQLIDSICNRLLNLPAQTIVYPGHGPHTTIAHEAQYNPYLFG